MGLVILVPIVSLISITAASLDTSRVTWRTTETAFSAIHAAVDVGAVVVNIQVITRILFNVYPQNHIFTCSTPRNE